LRALTAMLLAAIAPTLGEAQEDALSSKSQYNLFRRTPADLRRPLSTDRPDRTESPHTVDAGLFQVEVDVFTYRGDGSADALPGVESSSIALAPINIKAGLLHNVDLQFVMETWASNQRTEGGNVQRQRGLGAITVRTKVNIWGNDAGRTAFAIMPVIAFVAEPGASQRVVNYGVIMPLKVDLGAGWSLGTMLQFDLAHDAADAPRRVVAIGSASVGRGIVGSLSFYVEVYGGTVIADASGDWEGTSDLGLTLALGQNLQLDAGLNLGLTRAAEDVNPFLGLAFRF
jgi:hypothetical protein